MKYISIFRMLLMVLMAPLFTLAQSADQNYVKTAKVLVSGITTEAALNAVISDKTKARVGIAYLDGLRRPLQNVQYQGSPLGKDMIQPFAYDNYGREVKKYLSYTDNGTSTGNYRAAAISSQQSFYNSPPSGVISIPSGSGQVAYSETKFEASPLDRVQQEGFPGGDWKIGGTHTLRKGYAANAVNDVRKWVVTSNGATGSSYYPKARLYVDTLTDENGNKTMEYKDYQGRVVLKRLQNGGSFLNTYYVYDELSNLRYVIPPGFTATSFVESDAGFDQFIYAYRYNGKRLVTEKKIPGKGWEFLVYNKTGRLVMSQDAMQRSISPQQWTVFKYDNTGRQVMTGIYDHTGSTPNTAYRSTQQAAVDADPDLWETRIATGTGYTANTYPSTLSQTLLISYYNNYTIPGKTSTYNATQTVTSRTQGLATGSKVNILGTSTMLLTVNYYDERGRLKESVSDHQLGGTDRVVNTWNFADELTASTRTHTSSGGSVTVAMRYEYDHAGRKTKTYEKINTDAEVLLSELGYNELGQLLTKKLNNGLHTTTMSYNSRGWLTGKSAALFAMQLKYNDGTTPRYNGDITGQLWGTPGSLTKNYTYNYDQLNRLLSGISGTGNDEKNISYDAMGNILTLTRDNGTAQTYSYSGNRLSSVSGGVSRTYTYDLNGNVLTDGTNTFTYNYLNLPKTVSGGMSITYTYDASGRKLRSVNAGVTKDYIDGIHYTSGAIDFIQTEEGRARKSGASYLYEYNLQDHLGNTRLSFDIYSGAVRDVQHDDYYPFGKTFNSYLLGAKNNYLYNGKELQGGLEQYDYSSRLYDPVVGRWNVIDPLAELGRKWSPYSYAMGNPIRFIDPDGMWAYDANGNFTTSDLDEITSVLNRLKNRASDFSSQGKWQPLDKSTLLNYVKNTKCKGCGIGQLQNKTGAVFEELFEDFIDENCTMDNFRVIKNPLKLQGDFDYTIPDFLGLSYSVGKKIGAKISSFYEIESFYELKATQNNIGKGSFDGQLKVQIQAAKRAKVSEIIIITTYGVNLSQQLVNYAKNNGVTITQYWAQYQMVGGEMKTNYISPKK
ncbi:DUF6443 domain-containing protein [Pedobacter sp. FW305-3-2-15-E-R2A2]|uniref:DUF6443 domain-containing protein n=1 Tax=Pedobacter sp. FW305-3-2-15-E-R2A2 TaxID=3140251 RepID=UPI003140AF55